MLFFLVVNKSTFIVEGISKAFDIDDLGSLSGHDYVEYSGPLSTSDLVDKTYLLDGVVKTLPMRPDELYNFNINTQAWEVDLLSLQDKFYNIIRLDLQDFIFLTSDFPVWKQVNYSDTGTQLELKQLSSTLLATEQLNLDNIVLVRAWKDVLLTERNRVKALIYSAINLTEIKTAFDSMTYSPPPFSL